MAEGPAGQHLTGTAATRTILSGGVAQIHRNRARAEAPQPLCGHPQRPLRLPATQERETWRGKRETDAADRQTDTRHLLNLSSRRCVDGHGRGGSQAVQGHRRERGRMAPPTRSHSRCGGQHLPAAGAKPGPAGPLQCPELEEGQANRARLPGLHGRSDPHPGPSQQWLRKASLPNQEPGSVGSPPRRHWPGGEKCGQVTGQLWEGQAGHMRCNSRMPGGGLSISQRGGGDPPSAPRLSPPWTTPQQVLATRGRVGPCICHHCL